MAEIRVEQKRRGLGWLWLLLALLLIGAAVWYFFYQGGGTVRDDTPRTLLDAAQPMLAAAHELLGRAVHGLAIA